MHARLLAAVISAACLLSACGFVPPAPPKPGDGPRIAINHGDPRMTAQPTTMTAEAPSSTDPANVAKDMAASAAQLSSVTAVAAIPIPASPPEPPAAASPSPTPTPTSTTAPIQVASTTLAISAALPTLPTQAEPLPPAEPAAPSSAPAATPQSEPAPTPTPVVHEPIVPKPVWQIQPEDGTVRQALVRWATKAGWTFGPDQWELDFDLPIQAPAQFEADSFEDATRALSEAIAMTELPVRPCFYANHVLRVIPFTRSCNRAAAATP